MSDCRLTWGEISLQQQVTVHSTKRAMLASASALPTALHTTVLIEPSHLKTNIMGLQDHMT